MVQSSVKSIGKCKKKSLYNQPKPYFFKKILWSNFWIDFNKYYTKTFRIVNIWLFIYSLCCYELFLFVHNLNTPNKNWFWFSYIYFNYQTHIFFKKLLWNHFWIECNKFYTKTFGIVYILFVYLLKSLWVVFICT
jgi:hypothetical protein